MKTIGRRTGLLTLLLTGCASLWMGDGAQLPELVDKTQSAIESGGKGHEYIGVDTRKERTEVETKLTRPQSIKGTKAADFHWAALKMLTQASDLPAWAVRFDIEATVLTSNGLAAWEQLQPKEEENKKDKKDKKDKKKEGPSLEGVTSLIELTRPAKGEPWRIEDLALDIEGESFAPYATKQPFGNGAVLTKEEANQAVFDASLFTGASPFDSAGLIGSFGGALAAGDSRALFLVAFAEKKTVDDLAERLTKQSNSSQEIQTILSAAPKFTALPANITELKVTLRGDNGERLSYTIKKTKEGYRITSLKARAKKSGTEFDLKTLLYEN